MKKYSEKSLFSILRTLGIGCALSIATSCSNNIKQKNSYDNVNSPKKHNPRSNKRQQDKKNSSGGSQSKGQSLPKTKPKKQKFAKQQPVTKETQPVVGTCKKDYSSKDIQTVQKTPEKDVIPTFYFCDNRFRDSKDVKEKNINHINVESWFYFWNEVISYEKKCKESDDLKNCVILINFDLNYEDFCTIDTGIHSLYEKQNPLNLRKNYQFSLWLKFLHEVDEMYEIKKIDGIKFKLYLQDSALFAFVEKCVPEAFHEMKLLDINKVEKTKNKEIKELKKIIDNLIKEVGNNKTIKNELSSNVDKLTGKVNLLEQKNKNLESRNKNLLNDLKKYQQMRLSEIVDELEEQKEQNKKLENKLKEQEEQDQKLKNKLELKSSNNIDLDFKIKYDYASVQLTDLQERYKKLKVDRERKITELEKECEKLEKDKERELEKLGREKDEKWSKKYGSLWDSYISEANKIKAHKETIKTQESEIETLENEKTELKSTIDSLKKEIEKMNEIIKKIKPLQDKRGEMGGKIARLQNEKEISKKIINSLQNEKKAFEMEISFLQKEKKEFESKKTEMNSIIDSLQGKIGKMKGTISNLKKDKEDFEMEISYLKKEKEEFESKKTEMESKINSLQIELKRMQQRARMSLFDSIGIPENPFLSNLEVQIPFRQNNLFAYNDMIISNNRFSRGMIEHESGELNHNEEAYVGSIRRNTLSTSNDMRNNIFVKGSRNRINNVSQKANPEEKSHIEHVSDSNSKNENSPSLSLFSSDSPNSFGDDDKK